MEKSRKKELVETYKSRKIIGGVYAIVCTDSGEKWLCSTHNLAGHQNRFEFSQATNACPESVMRSAWQQYGAAAFQFTILQALEKKEEQSDREFREEIKLLHEIWMEKLNETN